MNKLIIFHLLKKKKKKKRYGHHILTVNLKSEIKIFKKSNFSWNLMRTHPGNYIFSADAVQDVSGMVIFFSIYFTESVDITSRCW